MNRKSIALAIIIVFLGGILLVVLVQVAQHI